MPKKQEHSIVELFVFVGFICLIFSVSVSMLSAAQEDARVARARADVLELKRMALIAAVQSGDKIHRLTGQSCSACACERGYDAVCRQAQADSFTKLSVFTEGVIELVPELLTDPWGSPYFIRESDSARDGICSALIYSAGKDKKMATSEDNVSVTAEESC